jgi:hypothetical protein
MELIMKQIAFMDADKYLTALDYYDKAPFKPEKDIHTSYGSFFRSGEYVIKAGFLFSANSPAINTLDSRRGAGIHDFFYNLMKDGLLPRSFRYDVDYYFYNILLEDGMIPLRAFGWFKAVRIGGDEALDSPKPKVQYAPRDPSTIPNINRHRGLI